MKNHNENWLFSFRLVLYRCVYQRNLACFDWVEPVERLCIVDVNTEYEELQQGMSTLKHVRACLWWTFGWIKSCDDINLKPGQCCRIVLIEGVLIYQSTLIRMVHRYGHKQNLDWAIAHFRDLTSNEIEQSFDCQNILIWIEHRYDFKTRAWLFRFMRTILERLHCWWQHWMQETFTNEWAYWIMFVHVYAEQINEISHETRATWNRGSAADFIYSFYNLFIYFQRAY